MGEDERNLDMVELWSGRDHDIAEIKRQIYESASSPLWARYLDWKRELQLPERARTIEVGCGHGKFSMLLGLAGEDPTLLDYNEAVLAKSRKWHREIGLEPRTVSGDLMKLSYEMEGVYDVVCSFGTLEHFRGEHRLAAFQANARFLRQGGLLFFTVPNRHAVFYRIAWGLRRRLALVPAHFYEQPFSRGELSEMAQCSSISPLEIRCLGTLKGDFDYWILENVKSLIRNVSGRKRALPEEPVEIDLEEIDLTTAAEETRTGYFDQHFSYNLMFAGRKVR